jgi:heterodisulfide reductase subunit C
LPGLIETGATPVAAIMPPTATSPSLRERVLALTGTDAARCYQCGKCSAGCPMTPETRLRPHDVMRIVARDNGGGDEHDAALERLRSDDSIWLCLACETCSARCPNECEPARVVEAVREIVLHEAPGAMPPRVAAFHRAFLDQIRHHGRMFELGMVIDYKLRTGAMFQDAASAPALAVRGKLHLAPERIEGRKEVARIFARCLGKERR